MFCIWDDSLPDWSFTIQVTMVSPNGNTSGASFVILTSWISLISGICSNTSLPLETVASIVRSLTIISGGVVSFTITLCDDVPVFPDESVTIHVTVVSPIEKFCGASLPNDITFTWSNTSGSINDTVFSFILVASTIMSSIISTRGGSESIRITFCCIVDIFCITSVIVQVTLVSPNENTFGASLSMEIIPTASYASGVLSFTRFWVSDLASSVISVNCSTSGDVVSWTVTLCDAIAIFPDPSIAVHITVVMPRGNSSPTLFDKDNIPLSSSADAFPILTEVRAPVASITMFSGTDIVGFVKSFGIGFTSGSSVCVSEISSNSDIDSFCSDNASSTIAFSAAIGVKNFWILCPIVSVM